MRKEKKRKKRERKKDRTRERKRERDRLKHETLVILCKEIRVNHHTIAVKETRRPEANVIYNVFIFSLRKQPPHNRCEAAVSAGRLVYIDRSFNTRVSNNIFP